ncbi:uncharacterized protein PHALS_05518 [Plasmopara halstedii]|uniref:Uncharacterized protein n=1 Tax=Plasmopara halstedii TaxID=4781 RepID=A0A0P1B2E2_PLAHL|nr:uncharacterized protein PHALS_05518 [Plasmopara halstedii]CEG48041.1 hypothetical protein PHALS_05518 [Plasmopara halstedii]|eukprot:XP_024584410.1 hypothetical protein PHALS_05518 [Plasmopara halstedii]
MVSLLLNETQCRGSAYIFRASTRGTRQRRRRFRISPHTRTRSRAMECWLCVILRVSSHDAKYPRPSRLEALQRQILNSRPTDSPGLLRELGEVEVITSR